MDSLSPPPPKKVDKITELLASIQGQQRPMTDPHDHRVLRDLVDFRTSEDFYDYVIFLKDGCPACDRLRSTNAIYRTESYARYWNHRGRTVPSI